MTDELAIEATGLKKSFGDVRVLGGVDLRVARGTVFALLGPNGAGKTTTVRILTTLTRADGGRALVAGHDVDRERHLVRRSISLAGQYAAVDGLQTGAENLRMMGRLAGLSRGQARRRAGELLEQFGLAEAARRRVANYSGGMRRRLDLAASLVGAPSVIFLDEPTTGLDLPSRQVMWQVIARLAGDGVTVFLTTQYLEEADLLAGRIAVLDGGRVVADGTPADLKELVSGQSLDLLLADSAAFDRVAARTAGRALRTDRDGLAISLPTDGTAARVRALLDELDPERSAIRSFSVHTATLDDVFLAVTRPGRAAARKEQETTHV
ncbi:MAG TPA: ATP-binding cassette domain-containing protein [Streptosporangiaceae bacterium]|nr:ATP-binding cassette domain-containing protein [Streptosporangiaceae bacterium]